jgi:CheY-like chemotaxis protein
MKKESAPPVRILLVDDNVLGSTARGMILTEQGYTVETARSGDEAWELFQREQFDIVVTDYKMPGMNGIELISLIRAAHTPARIILLSGRIKDMGMTEKSTGADELVSKSNKEVPELIRAVKKLAVRPRRRGVASQKAVAKTAAKAKNAQA